MNNHCLDLNDLAEMNNDCLDLNDLAESLYRLSKMKNDAVFRLFSVMPKSKSFGKSGFHNSLKVRKPTIYYYLNNVMHDKQVFDLYRGLISPFDEVPCLYDNALEVNPFFSCFLNTKQNFDLLKYNLSNDIKIRDQHRLWVNASLVYLYQKVRHDSTKQKAIQFYKTVDSRNKSIRRLINYNSDQEILCFQVSATLNSSDDFSHCFNEMTLCRKGIITHLRNHFKDSGVLKQCKYIWRVNIDRNERLVFTITIISTNEGSIFSEFCDAWISKLNKYVSQNNWEQLSISIDKIKSLVKTDLVSSLLELPVVIMNDPMGHKKSVFGLGGLGGRKYK